MMVGMGIDLVNIEEFKVTILSNDRARDKIFTKNELLFTDISLAASFASKEALIKALGTIEEFSWKNAEIIHENSGKPRFIFHNEMSKLMEQYQVSLSISHTSKVAVSIVLLQNI
jgi:holo-[acyl-carrier protein] synthase